MSPIPQSEYADRRRRFLEALGERKLDAAVVGSPANVRYLTGFTGSNGMLVAADGRFTLLTDPRYRLQVARETSCRAAAVRGPLPAAALKRLRKARRIGFENKRIRFEEHQGLDKDLPVAAALEPLGDVLERLRMVKSAAETALIRRAVELNSAAYTRAIRRLHPSMTEKDFAAELDYQIRRLGADGSAFETIVAAGTRSALPHARPGKARIGPIGLLLVDVGACLDGYLSDMTRVCSLGRPPAIVRRMYRAVLEAQLAAIDAVKHGIAAGRIDSAARKVLRSHGLVKEFVHSTGHGLGLEIHEPPRLGKKEKMSLEAGMVITIEPGVYVEGCGGIRIEDTVLVTPVGCEVLTPTPKELMVI